MTLKYFPVLGFDPSFPDPALSRSCIFSAPRARACTLLAVLSTDSNGRPRALCVVIEIVDSLTVLTLTTLTVRSFTHYSSSARFMRGVAWFLLQYHAVLRSATHAHGRQFIALYLNTADITCAHARDRGSMHVHGTCVAWVRHQKNE